MDHGKYFLSRVPARKTDDEVKNAILERMVNWLSANDDGWQLAVAARAAIRFTSSVALLDDIAEQDSIALATLRCSLTAAVGAVFADGMVRRAARQASQKYEARMAAIRAASASNPNGRNYSAGRTGVVNSFAACFAASRRGFEHIEDFALRAIFYEPRSTAPGSYDETFEDMRLCATLEAPAKLFNLPLYRSPSSGSERSAELLNAYWTQSDGPWTFWRDWYRGIRDGEPIDWELQRQIALIPDEDWEKGPARIADLIEYLHLIKKTDVAPSIELDARKGVFSLINQAPISPEILAFAAARISSALENALSAGNGFGADDYESLAIRKALEGHSNDASLLATSFHDAYLGLERNIGDRYPPDTSLINLRQALYAVREEICEADQLARTRCHRLESLLPLAPTPPAVRREAPEVAEALAVYADDKVQAILRSDATTIAAAPRAPAWIVARFSHYFAKIALWIDQSKKNIDRGAWLFGILNKIIRWISGYLDT